MTSQSPTRPGHMKETKKLRPADERLISFLAEHGHMSPFRHAMVQGDQGPLMVARQWFKYRIGAAHTPDTAEYLGLEVPQALLWGGQGDDGGSGAGDLLQGRNEASRRYVTLPPEFYVPAADAWRSTPEDSKQGSERAGDGQRGGDPPPAGHHRARHRRVRVGPGAGDLRRAGAPLPAGLRPDDRVALDLLGAGRGALLKQRLGDDAQAEIRRYAEAVRDLTQPLFPHSLARLCQE